MNPSSHVIYNKYFNKQLSLPQTFWPCASIQTNINISPIGILIWYLFHCRKELPNQITRVLHLHMVSTALPKRTFLAEQVRRRIIPFFFISSRQLITWQPMAKTQLLQCIFNLNFNYLPPKCICLVVHVVSDMVLNRFSTGFYADNEIRWDGKFFSGFGRWCSPLLRKPSGWHLNI